MGRRGDERPSSSWTHPIKLLHSALPTISSLVKGRAFCSLFSPRLLKINRPPTSYVQLGTYSCKGLHCMRGVWTSSTSRRPFLALAYPCTHSLTLSLISFLSFRIGWDGLLVWPDSLHFSTERMNDDGRTDGRMEAVVGLAAAASRWMVGPSPFARKKEDDDDVEECNLHTLCKRGAAGRRKQEKRICQYSPLH